MKKLFVLALMVGLVGVVSLSSQAVGSPHRVIITLEGEVNDSAIAALESRGGKIIKKLPLVNGLVVMLPSEAVVPTFSTLTGVKKVEADAKVFALGKPSNVVQPAETLEWGVNRIDADLAWATSKGTGVKVAIIDTGIDKDHPDLVANLKGGTNFVAPGLKAADPNKWNDDNGHGTHVAGIVAAVDNSIGVIGVAPEASLYAVKVLDKNGSGYVSDVIDGIYWAIQNGMQVINMSLGSASDVQALHDAVDAAYNSGILVVAAAGNSGDGNPNTNEVIYPAKYSSVIAVAATASDDSVPTWSSSGVEVELAAPGVSIRSTWNDNMYKTISGTSMATPHVTGVVALKLSSGMLASDVRANLQATAQDLGMTGFDYSYGYGLVKAY